MDNTNRSVINFKDKKHVHFIKYFRTDEDLKFGIPNVKLIFDSLKFIGAEEMYFE